MDNESILEFGKDKFCNTQGKQNIIKHESRVVRGMTKCQD